MEIDGIAETNAFAAQATVAAYEKGEEWFDALREYIFENKKRVLNFLKEERLEDGLCRLRRGIKNIL